MRRKLLASMLCLMMSLSLAAVSCAGKKGAEESPEAPAGAKVMSTTVGGGGQTEEAKTLPQPGN